MTIIGDIDRIAHARKRKQCDWCGEWIEIGDPACRYLWKDGADLLPCRMHPECFGASCDATSEFGYDYEFQPGQFSRGCSCDRGRCRCAKARGEAAT